MIKTKHNSIYRDDNKYFVIIMNKTKLFDFKEFILLKDAINYYDKNKIIKCKLKSSKMINTDYKSVYEHGDKYSVIITNKNTIKDFKIFTLLKDAAEYYDKHKMMYWDLTPR